MIEHLLLKRDDDFKTTAFIHCFCSPNRLKFMKFMRNASGRLEAVFIMWAKENHA